ncbi:MAG: outer membrane lipoprotein-sorting protein [Gammaproteobacteria bacterium]|nr:outer membrane lipoprotein-sorting protein [Pseudomonadales bacterium]MCP5348151.1 outer membrane lipoprotein-sorting protein [Pseudomonadales bacterium]
MKQPIILLTAAALASAVSFNGSAAELSAAEIIQRNDSLDDGDSAIIDYRLVLVDRRNRQRERHLRMFAKDYGEDTRTLTQFDSPADIRGTGYLNYDWDDPDMDDDSWLYLPALQRVKRIATSDTSDSFLGSDFTYADINGLEIKWYDYSFYDESEVIDGQDCWVIDIVPKPEFRDRAEQATGYSRLRTWIRKDNFVEQRSQAWELRGNRVKYFNSTDIAQVDGIWTIRRLQVVTTRNNRQEHASVLQMEDVTYNVPLDDELFTTENLERGLD